MWKNKGKVYADLSINNPEGSINTDLNRVVACVKACRGIGKPESISRALSALKFCRFKAEFAASGILIPGEAERMVHFLDAVIKDLELTPEVGDTLE